MVPSHSTKRFIRHYLEMVVAMFAITAADELPADERQIAKSPSTPHSTE